MPRQPDTLDPVRPATEGAVWGSIKAHGFLPDTVIVSDDAGLFAVGEHALCWVHAERLIHQLNTFTDHQRAGLASEEILLANALERLRGGLRSGGDVTLTANTTLYSSRKNLAPRKINDLGCAKSDLVGQPNGYTQLM